LLIEAIPLKAVRRCWQKEDSTDYVYLNYEYILSGILNVVWDEKKEEISWKFKMRK